MRDLLDLIFGVSFVAVGLLVPLAFLASVIAAAVWLERRWSARHRATIERLEEQAVCVAWPLNPHRPDTYTLESIGPLLDRAEKAEAEVARLRVALCEIGWANRLTGDERVGIARAALSTKAST